MFATLGHTLSMMTTVVPSGDIRRISMSLSYVWLMFIPITSTSDSNPMLPGTLRVDVTVVTSGMGIGTSAACTLISHAGVGVMVGVCVRLGVLVTVGVFV